MSSNDKEISITIKCNRWAAEELIPLLKELEHMGNIGSSRGIKIEDWDGKDSFGFDGDGPSKITSIDTGGLDMEKAKKMPVGTISHGRKKVAEGKWVPVGHKRKKGHAKAQGTLPNDVSTLTVENATSLIAAAVKMPLSSLRRNQDIVEQQKGKAYEKKNDRAMARLDAMGEMYTAAVAVKEFKDSTPEEWAEEIVGRIQRNVKREAQRKEEVEKSIKFSPIEAKALKETIEELFKGKGSTHINPDGTFKGGFKGCVSHQMGKGLAKENATKLCAYIGRKAGKIP